MNPLSQLKTLRLLAKEHPFAATAGAGALVHSTFAVTVLAVEWPEGDPHKLRQAADILDRLAADLDTAHDAADMAAAQVWKGASGPGIDAFRGMWLQGSAAAPGGVTAYPPRVAEYARRMAAACRGYASCLDTIRRVLNTLAMQAFANMLMTSLYGWPTSWVAGEVKDKIIQRFFQNLARIQLRLFGRNVANIVANCFYYPLDSLLYAGLQQGLQYGIFAWRGVRRDMDGTEVLSRGVNAKQFATGFTANVAFDGVWDLTKVLGVPRNSRVGDFASRMSGSAAYSIVSNLLQDPTGNPVPTDWQTWLGKFLTHGVRSIKPSG
ncbi:hypothetical protein Sru01_33280 [Sphaerisporangium rufum]|uniref:Outer membrane channel protein CpnT-like N-terminal domain-containing protein n=1 Tax=Sphaerisporangium rufum TaxID=1381558 RepID=A0A919R4P9_9ACTN|nr:hypothetical protein [Sphaerisporangium rufum]GII78346.1 hypothetical protein Sru01_33280 [Sphaerisporangium rufum]